MIDDDIYGCQSLTGRLLRQLSQDEMRAVILTTARAAKEAKAPLFGFSQSLDLTVYRPHDFIRTVGMIGTVVGVTGKYCLWDESLKVRVDVDATLSALRKWRVIWIDTRFCFTLPKDINPGGSSMIRDAGTLSEDYARLQRKWGKFLGVYAMPDYTNLVIHVQRRRRMARFYRDLHINSED